MHIHVGPVASSATRAWTAHLVANLGRMAQEPERLPFKFPADVATWFNALLEEWHAAASATETFEWAADADAETVRVLVQYWANFDSLTDDHMHDLGLEWSPREARPFFVALARAVDDAFRSTGEVNPYARLLAERADVIELELGVA